jgi:hypothetical protein
MTPLLSSPQPVTLLTELSWPTVNRLHFVNSLRHRVQIGSGAPHSLLSSGYRRVLTPGVKLPGVKLTIHLRLLPKLRMRGAVSPLTKYVFVASCLVKHRDNFAFTKVDTWHHDGSSHKYGVERWWPAFWSSCWSSQASKWSRAPLCHGNRNVRCVCDVMVRVR